MPSIPVESLMMDDDDVIKKFMLILESRSNAIASDWFLSDFMRR